jgi:hypothetical protein
MAAIKILNTSKIDSCLNSFREVFSDPLKSGDDNAFNPGVILPLDFSIEMDGLSGIIPHSAFVIPSNTLPSSYLIQTGDDKGKQKIAFILHTIEQNFSENKWTTKLTGQTLSIRFEPLTEEEKKQIQSAKDFQKSLSVFSSPTMNPPPPTTKDPKKKEVYKNNSKGNGARKQGYAYVRSKYGEIGARINADGGDGLVNKSLLKTFTFPFTMYNPYIKPINTKITKSVQVHALVYDKFVAIFNEIKSTFTPKEIHDRGYDIQGGCYVPRLQRGGSYPSIHTWGIAMDINPALNGNKNKNGLFSNPIHKPYIDIWYKHGFKSYGREKGRDWMHFQVNDVIF